MSFRRLSALALFSLPFVASFALAQSTGDDPVVLSMGHEQWTASQFKRVMVDTPPQLKATAAEDPALFAKRYAEMHLLAQLGQSRQLDQDPDVRQQIEWLREGIMANAAREDMYRRAQVSDEEVKRYYDAHSSDFIDYSLQHLVIRYHGSSIPLKAGQKDMTEDEARAEAETLRKQILQGKDFAELVGQYSDDADSKSEGGMLPETSSRNLLPEIAQGVAGVKENEISQPIKTQYGYHLVRVIKRSANTFEDARPHIVILLKAVAVDKQVEAMKQAQPVTLNPAFFGEHSTR